MACIVRQDVSLQLVAYQQCYYPCSKCTVVLMKVHSNMMCQAKHQQALYTIAIEVYRTYTSKAEQVTQLNMDEV